MIIRKTSVTVIFILSFLSLFSQSSLAVDKIDPSIRKGANAVVRYEHVKVTLAEISKLEREVERAVTVLNSKAEGFLTFYEYYEKGISKIKDLKIEIYDRSGKLLKEVKKSDIEDYAYQDGVSLISSGRVMYYNYETIDFPVTMKTSYKMSSKNTSFLSSWYPITSSKVGVEKSTYSISVAEDLEVFAKELNLDKYDNINKNGLSYSISDLKPIKYEKYGPHFTEFAPIVYFQANKFNYNGYIGSSSTWNDFGRWQYDSFMSENRFSNEDKIRFALNPLLEKKTSRTDTIKAIYDFVQENTRYIGIQLKEGGWKPMELDKVHTVKYGDCKALSYYTIGLLDLYDIPADYVLVNANSLFSKSLLQDFASGSQANHAIVRVPHERTEDIWLECTSHYAPFNFLGSFTDDRNALVVNADTSYLVRTPSYIGQDVKEYLTEVSLLDDDIYHVHAKVVNSGLNYSSAIGRSLLDEEDRKNYISKRLFSFLNVHKVGASSYLDQESELKYIEGYNLEVKSLAESMGDYLLLPVGFIDIEVPKLTTKNKRINELVFYKPYERVSTTTYTLPQHFKAQIENRDVNIDNEYCSYELSMSQEGDKLTVRRRFKLKEGRYSPEIYNTVAKHMKAIRKQECRMITIVNKT